MQLIVIGENRAEHCTVKRGDEEKHFMSTRGQLYMIMPDALTRCIRTRFGRRVKDEEIIVFSENATKPYNTGKTVCYAPSMVLGTIDLHKSLQPNSFFGKGSILAKQIKGIYNAIYPVLGFIIVGIVLAYSYLA